MRDHEKFKTLVHYVVSRRRDAPDTLGAVKLNKILWLSDLSSYYETGKSITTSRYIKQKFGPVPASVMPVLRELEREGVLAVDEAPHYGKMKTLYKVYKTRVDTSVFEPGELEIVNEVIDHVCDSHTAKSISEASHDHIWKAAADGEEIPLFTVFARPGKVTEMDRQWASMKLEEEFA
jgi:hypothetical protein